jgi:hypothetical protein
MLEGKASPATRRSADAPAQEALPVSKFMGYEILARDEKTRTLLLTRHDQVTEGIENAEN